MKLMNLKNPFGAPVYHEETVSSTMETARVLAGQNEAHGTVIAADFQEAGRGRLARPWVMERAKNLICTILLRYDDISSIPKALTLKTGLAVSLAVEDLVPALAGSVLVKWPNDIMISPRGTQAVWKAQAAYKAEAAYKAAGILTEGDGRNVYIGIGVNVAQKEFPEEYRSKAGSIIRAFPDLKENARFDLLEKILARLYDEIEKPQYREDDSWRERLGLRLYKKGGAVSFVPGAADSVQVVEGTLSGIGPNGELLIIPKGETTERAFITGELRVY